MVTCDRCGRQENMPYNCRFCGGTFCSEHRLPENHSCPGLQDWNDPSGVFDSGFDDSVNNQGRQSNSRFRIDTRAGGPLGYFRGNMSYVFLALIWITFLAQWIALLVGGGRLHNALFVLEPAHVEYIWTWITSMFAHSPANLWHIAGNSIVLYFFGPPVERYVGSKRFTALFLVSGIVAGLAQIGTALFVNGSGAGVLGASGAIMAVMGVLTVLNPNLRVWLLIPPIPVPIWALTGFYVVLSVVGFLGPVSGGIAHFAHLAGLLIGLGYGQYVKGRKRAPQRLQMGGRGGGMGGGRRRF